MKFSSPLIGLFAGAHVLVAPSVRAQAAQTTKPNIIFILADDLGYGELGSYGQKAIQTPALDRMAAEGMRFTQFYAGNTVCAPSRSVVSNRKRRSGFDIIKPIGEPMEKKQQVFWSSSYCRAIHRR